MKRRTLAATMAALAALALAALTLAPRGAGAAVAPSVAVSVLVGGAPQPAYFSAEMLGPLALALFPTENNRFADLGGGLRAVWSRYPDPYRTYWGLAGHSARAWLTNLRPPPFILANGTGVLLSVTGSLDPAEYINPFGLYSGYRKLMTATRLSSFVYVSYTRDVFTGINWGGITVVEGPGELTRPPDWGEPISVVYQFYFKADQVFTVNFAKAFYAWLFNSEYGRVDVTATDGSTVPLDPMDGETLPVDTFIVVGDGQASFSRDAYRVAREVARAEPSVQVQGGLALSAVFVFDRDVTVTEVAVYVRLRCGKEVMLLYYVYPQPVQVRAGEPFPAAFTVRFPFG
jgi:hypothetical protein